MKKLLLIALSTSMAMSAHALDDKKFHVGGGLSAWKISADSSAVSGQFNLTTLDISGAYSILPWLDVDGKFGVGIDNETTDFQSSTGIFTVDDAIIDEAQPADPADPNSTATEEVTAPAVGQTFSRRPINAQLNFTASLHLKPQVKNDVAAFYGLLGMSFVDAEYELANSTSRQDTYLGTIGAPQDLTLHNIGETMAGTDAEVISESNAYLSFGLGVSFFFDEWTVNAEYINVVDSEELGNSGTSFKTSNVSMNVRYSF